jgi:hypothetical protein
LTTAAETMSAANGLGPRAGLIWTLVRTDFKIR